MSGTLYELLRKQTPATGLWHGTVASNPTDLSDRIDVIVPDFDELMRWEGLRWQSRDSTSLPVRGDVCLVAVGNREPWVIAWWPY